MKKSDFLKLSPMLLKEINKPFNDDNYLYELKFDGVRALIYINKNEIIIKSRNNTILNNIYPELLNIKKLVKNECILDGEIIILDEFNKPSFSKLQERIRLKNKDKIKNMSINNPVSFVCFDILYNNKDLTNYPLLKRKEILNKIKDNNIFIKSVAYNNGIKLFNLVKKENLEGIIAKKKDSLYTYNKRVDYWIKIKNFKEEEFFIGGYSLTKNDKLLSVILCEKINNKYYFVGKMSYSNKNDLFNKIKNSKTINNYLINYNNKNINYIKPIYKVKVNYMERTNNNLLRQPFIRK